MFNKEIQTVSQILNTTQSQQSNNCIQSTDNERKELEMSFMILYNPDKQIPYTQDRERCVFGKAPTLGALNRMFFPDSACTWLIAQLTNLADFLGCKAVTANQLLGISELIVDRYYYLKVTELMLFFKKLKYGDYCKFYNAINAADILTSLHDFVNDCRASIIAKHDSRDL